MGQDSLCHEAKFSWWTEIWIGREESQIRYRENVRCESVSMKHSADATGSLEVEVTLQICPRLERRGPGLHTLVLIQLLNISHPGKGAQLWRRQLSSAETIIAVVWHLREGWLHGWTICADSNTTYSAVPHTWFNSLLSPLQNS